jgi:hypothetical protein
MGRLSTDATVDSLTCASSCAYHRKPRRDSDESGRTRSVLLPSGWAWWLRGPGPGPPVICSGISTTATATTNNRPQKGIAVFPPRLFLAQCKARRSGTALLHWPVQRQQSWLCGPNVVQKESPDRLTCPSCQIWHPPRRKRGARPYAGTGTRCKTTTTTRFCCHHIGRQPKPAIVTVWAF